MVPFFSHFISLYLTLSHFASRLLSLFISYKEISLFYCFRHYIAVPMDSPNLFGQLREGFPNKTNVLTGSSSMEKFTLMYNN
jgi:hypothetical protein